MLKLSDLKYESSNGTVVDLTELVIYVLLLYSYDFGHCNKQKITGSRGRNNDYYDSDRTAV